VRLGLDCVRFLDEMDDIADDLPNEDEDDFDFFADEVDIGEGAGPAVGSKRSRIAGQAESENEDGAAMIAAGDDSGVPPPVDVTEHFPAVKRGTAPMVMGVIAAMDLGVGVDLLKLAAGVHFGEYVMRRSPTVTMRIREPSCVALIRPTGVVALVGANSPAAARQAAEICARVVRHVLGLEQLTVFKFSVRSMMARVDLRHPIKLDEVQRRHGHLASYEPEVFCGCIVKLRGSQVNQWSASASVFATGRVTIVGARSELELQHAFNKLIPMLSPCAMKTTLGRSTEATLV
jgi:transcription initiation factor TFIID TATA-box-binding protein